MNVYLLIVGMLLLVVALAHGFLLVEYRAVTRDFGHDTRAEQRHQTKTAALLVAVAIACFALAWMT